MVGGAIQLLAVVGEQQISGCGIIGIDLGPAHFAHKAVAVEVIFVVQYQVVGDVDGFVAAAADHACYFGIVPGAVRQVLEHHELLGNVSVACVADKMVQMVELVQSKEQRVCRHRLIAVRTFRAFHKQQLQRSAQPSTLTTITTTRWNEAFAQVVLLSRREKHRSEEVCVILTKK